MAREDFTHSAKVTVGLPSAAVAANATGPAVDTSGFESVTFAGLVAGASAAADLTVTVEDSEDGAAFAPAAADDAFGEVVTVGAGQPDGAFQLGYRGDKRFVRLAVAVAGGQADVSAVCVLGHARQVPTY